MTKAEMIEAVSKWGKQAPGLLRRAWASANEMGDLDGLKEGVADAIEYDNCDGFVGTCNWYLN